MMNLYDLPRLPLHNEMTDILAENKSIRIERIISAGHVTGWYDQTESEFVVLLAGNVKIEFEGGRIINLSKGDTLLIRPHEKHRVSFTSSEPPCIWLCVFY